MALPKRKPKEFERRQRTIVSVAPFVAFDLMRENGYFRLPAKEPGKRYATTIVYDTISKQPLGDDKFQESRVDVDDLAESLINDNDADKFGCFVAVDGAPSEEELADAERTYDEWRRKQVAEADVLWQTHHKHIFIGQHARLACKELGLTREWNSTVSETKQCPNCAKPNILTQARCACGAILNYELAREFGLLSEREEARAIRTGKLTADDASGPAPIPAEARTTSLVDADEEIGTF